MSNLIVGIDPGLSGALVFLDGEGGFARELMPTITTKKGSGQKRSYNTAELRRMLFLDGDRIRHVFLEKQQAMPASLRGRNQGSASTFSTGYGFGLLVGLLAGLELPFSLVHPRTWQALLFRDCPKGDTKATALIVAQRLYPRVDLRASERSRIAHGGVVDALLIAEYGRRYLEGGIKRDEQEVLF